MWETHLYCPRDLPGLLFMQPSTARPCSGSDSRVNFFSQIPPELRSIIRLKEQSDHFHRNPKGRNEWCIEYLFCWTDSRRKHYSKVQLQKRKLRPTIELPVIRRGALTRVSPVRERRRHALRKVPSHQPLNKAAADTKERLHCREGSWQGLKRATIPLSTNVERCF